jgi:NTP pyrophosphatase (non-canonical NTP hydrolase)
VDSEASVADLKSRVRQFCEERDWDQFHGAKELAIGLVTESAELLDNFRFLSDQQVTEFLSDAARKRQIEDEMADVLFFLLRFAQRFGIDLDESLRRKTEENAEKYPVDRAKGSNLKYTGL